MAPLTVLLLVLCGGRGHAQEGRAWTFRWGAQRTDLVRFNRVEGLSVGARGQLRVPSAAGPLSFTALTRMGTADREVNVSVSAAAEGLAHRISWSAFHELVEVEEAARHLGLGNSVTALVLGRDNGEYYRRSGTALEWTPPSSRPRTHRVRIYAEYHRAAAAGTDFSLVHLGDDDWTFRENLTASEGWDVGGLLQVAPRWGTDPRRPRGGLTAALQGGAGDEGYVRLSGGGDVAVPLPADLGLRLAAGVGRAWGSPSPQRLWRVGGPASLRGYGPRAAEGRAFWRSRGEVFRTFAFGSWVLFSDAAWAWDPAEGAPDHALVSVGTGLSVLEGLIGVDAAFGLSAPRGFRLELYLDGVR